MQATQLPCSPPRLSRLCGGWDVGCIRLASSSSNGMSWTPMLKSGRRREGSEERRSETERGMLERIDTS